ncbi:MAG: ribosome silencing factor [Dehalococcoidia bacterium]
MIIEDTNKYTSLDYSKKAIEISSDALASEIILLDLKPINGFTDYFVILTVSSKRQADSLSDKIIKELKLIGCGIINSEGKSNDGWVLLDFGGFVIHIFNAEKREFYNLESAWPDAPKLINLL